METTKYVEYPKHALPTYIIEQLNMGILEGFFPASFIQTGEGHTGVYRIEGYELMSSNKDIPINVLLQVFLELLMLMDRMEYNYVFPEDYLIDEKSVYIAREESKIKLIYLENKERICAKEQLCCLLEKWTGMASEAGIGYLQSLCAYLQTNQVGYRSAMHHVETLYHEACVCDIL